MILGKGHAKGSTLVLLRQFVLEEHGRAMWETVLSNLHEDDREVVGGLVISGGWYPVGAWNRALATFLFEAYTSPDEGMRQVASYIADHDLNTVYKMVLKLGTPEFLMKRTGSLWSRYFDTGELTAEDLRHARKHPEFGWSILRTVEGLERAGLLILHHQECYDGSGYPAGLAGEEIPLGSRIIAVLDSFDAIATDRPYRRGLGNDEAFRRLRQGAGTQFDPEVVERFVTTAVEYFAKNSSDFLYQGGGYETLIV